MRGHFLDMHYSHCPPVLTIFLQFYLAHLFSLYFLWNSTLFHLAYAVSRWLTHLIFAVTHLFLSQLFTVFFILFVFVFFISRRHFLAMRYLHRALVLTFFPYTFTLRTYFHHISCGVSLCFFQRMLFVSMVSLPMHYLHWAPVLFLHFDLAHLFSLYFM